MATAAQPATVPSPFLVADPKSALSIPIAPTVNPYPRTKHNDFDEHGQVYSYYSYIMSPGESPIRDYELIYPHNDTLRLNVIPGLNFLPDLSIDVFTVKNTSIPLMGIDMPPKKAGLCMETNVHFSRLLRHISNTI
ncbi:hypothetical protein EX30DRAFT_375438 [Ascodesmis nigricans]|uniref:Uncharacterized protein n=1 Tax=Ascodesmis nigricans TaxID=341454 RepID=A0A4S2MMU1_9PEZI|nr:hypothetical protein EX30DRAFT_375438 [Ascodesmis nigricans]